MYFIFHIDNIDYNRLKIENPKLKKWLKKNNKIYQTFRLHSFEYLITRRYNT